MTHEINSNKNLLSIDMTRTHTQMRKSPRGEKERVGKKSGETESKKRTKLEEKKKREKRKEMIKRKSINILRINKKMKENKYKVKKIYIKHIERRKSQEAALV